MVQAGMSVDLFCLRETKSESQRETINGVKVRRLPMARKRGKKSAYVLQYSRFLIACLLILGRRDLEQEDMTSCTCIICRTFWHSVR